MAGSDWERFFARSSEAKGGRLAARMRKRSAVMWLDVDTGIERGPEQPAARLRMARCGVMSHLSRGRKRTTVLMAEDAGEMNEGRSRTTRSREKGGVLKEKY